MQHDQQHQQKSMMTEGDLLVPFQNKDPEGGPVYHPAIGKGALWGGIIGGILIGALAWLVASGAWPVVGLGQMAAGNYGAAAFMGFLMGSAVGGLTGSFIGINRMLKNHQKQKETS
ncbi:MAG: hypothetical protein WD555_06015 [Fulvivirga sp.]